MLKFVPIIVFALLLSCGLIGRRVRINNEQKARYAEQWYEDHKHLDYTAQRKAEEVDLRGDEEERYYEQWAEELKSYVDSLQIESELETMSQLEGRQE